MFSNSIKYHSRLAHYFSSQSLFFDGDQRKKPHIRKITELPWQLLKVKEWENLKNCLSDLTLLNIAYFQDEYFVRNCWKEIEINTDFTFLKAYKNIINEVNNYIENILPLVNNTGIGSGDIVDLIGNPLNEKSRTEYIQTLRARGVMVVY